VSEACAEQVMLPAIRDAATRTAVLADGFSCRTQIHELDSSGREAIHLAELLDRARLGAVEGPDVRAGDRPRVPGLLVRGGTFVAAAGAAVAAGATARAMRSSRGTRRG
jgi:hypothetical protein